MLIKITTHKEMEEKGWTLTCHIMYESKELAKEYVEQALVDLQNIQDQVLGAPLGVVLSEPLLLTLADKDVRNLIIGKLRKQAFNVVARRYRVNQKELQDANLGTVREQTT